MTSISWELMEGWSLQITCKIAKRVQTINIVIWQADILLQVNEYARSVIVRFTRRQIGKHTHRRRDYKSIHARWQCGAAGGRRRDTDKNTDSPLRASHHRSVAESEWHMFTGFVVFPPWCSNCSMGENRKSSLKRRGWICAFFISQTISPDRQEQFFFLCILSLLFSFFLFFSFLSSKIILQQQYPSPLYSTGKTQMQRAGSHTEAMKGSVYMVLMSLLPELKSSFNTIAFSLLVPPTSNMQRDRVKHAIGASERNSSHCQLFSLNFKQPWWTFFFLIFFQANAGWGVSEFIKSCRRRS